MQAITHIYLTQFANRQLGITDKNRKTSAERLSSGYRINRSADDAAGLKISEKMRWQLRGLNRCSQNIQDGISLCQVADGALNETTDILQRMRVLAVQAANGTNSDGDRESIEMEIAQLRNEIDRIARDTEFNAHIHPLNAPMTYTLESVVSGPSGPGSLPEFGPDEGLIKEMTFTFVADKDITYDGKQYKKGEEITVTGLTINGEEIWFNGDGIEVVHPHNITATTHRDFSTLKKADLQTDENGYLYFVNRVGERTYALYNFSFGAGTSNPDPIQFNSEDIASDFVSRGVARYMTIDDLYGKETDPSEPSDPALSILRASGYLGKTINIESGITGGQRSIQIHTINATCEGLGITGLTVATEDSAEQALELCDKAINRVSTYRSAFGATQNRLEYAKKIDDNTSENTQSAESRLRDTDMAEEMVQYSKMNILTQAGQSMLAQANQNSRGILNLIV